MYISGKIWKTTCLFLSVELFLLLLQDPWLLLQGHGNRPLHHLILILIHLGYLGKAGLLVPNI